MEATRRAEIDSLFAKAREQANALDDILTDLSWAVDGYYRAEQYVDEAEKEVERWETAHEC